MDSWHQANRGLNLNALIAFTLQYLSTMLLRRCLDHCRARVSLSPQLSRCFSSTPYNVLPWTPAEDNVLKSNPTLHESIAVQKSQKPARRKKIRPVYGQLSTIDRSKSVSYSVEDLTTTLPILNYSGPLSIPRSFAEAEAFAARLKNYRYLGIDCGEFILICCAHE